jgi:hypothetical protein
MDDDKCCVSDEQAEMDDFKFSLGLKFIRK